MIARHVACPSCKMLVRTVRNSNYPNHYALACGHLVPAEEGEEFYLDAQPILDDVSRSSDAPDAALPVHGPGVVIRHESFFDHIPVSWWRRIFRRR